MRTLLITVPASQDLEEISEYFLEVSVDAGDRFVENFAKKCQQLARYPYIGKSYAQIKPGLRGILLMNYIIFYQVFEDRIEIFRVISGYQNFQDAFTE